MQLAFYQPDIPQNLGTMLRLASCMNTPAHVIEPCSFPFGSKKVKRAGMDYLDQVDLSSHTSWNAFLAWRNEEYAKSRIILLTTKSPCSYVDFKFCNTDILLVGKESAGVPDDVYNATDYAIAIPMAPNHRSLNVAIASSMVLGEALRQTTSFPSGHS